MVVCRFDDFLGVFAAVCGKQFAAFAVRLPVYGKQFAANLPYACQFATLFKVWQTANGVVS